MGLATRRRGLGPMPPPRCQCSDACSRPVQKGQTFCDYHRTHGCPIRSPTSGAEPKFAPEEYNNNKAIQHSHNCFAYAMNKKDAKKIAACRDQGACGFHVPGKSKGHPDFTGQLGKTCGDVIGRTMADVPRSYLIDFSNTCKPNFSKIGVVVDEENDLHYYRQDSNGWWSHKPGGRKVTNLDAMGSRIYAPHLASRYYPPESTANTGLNYSSFCSYMCVPRDEDPNIIGGGRRRRVATRKRRRS